MSSLALLRVNDILANKMQFKVQVKSRDYFVKDFNMYMYDYER